MDAPKEPEKDTQLETALRGTAADARTSGDSGGAQKRQESDAELKERRAGTCGVLAETELHGSRSTTGTFCSPYFHSPSNRRLAVLVYGWCAVGLDVQGSPDDPEVGAVVGQGKAARAEHVWPHATEACALAASRSSGVYRWRVTGLTALGHSKPRELVFVHVHVTLDGAQLVAFDRLLG